MSADRRTLPIRERRARNRLIAEARASGEPWRSIGARFKLSERQARRAAYEARQIWVEVGLLDNLDAKTILRQGRRGPGGWSVGVRSAAWAR